MIPRVVLDTNTLVSALLFRAGRLSWLRHAWRSGEVLPLVSKETTRELLRVLAYPKFRLDETEIQELLGDFLPYAETCSITPGDMGAPHCRDPDDQMFLDLSLAARADALVTGDGDLLALADEFPIPIVTPAEFYRELAGG